MEIEIEGEYSSQTFTQASNVIHNYKAICERRNVHYADAFLWGDMTAEEFQKVQCAPSPVQVFSFFKYSMSGFHKEKMLTLVMLPSLSLPMQMLCL